MNIGIVTVWFECGAGYVSRQYKKILESKNHKVFIFARGGYYPKNDPLYASKDVTWSKPIHNPIGYSFDLEEFKSWMIVNQIETVLFNEQTWLKPLLLCTQLGIKTGAYIDYYTKDTLPLFEAYDFMICNTKRHFSVFNHQPQVYCIPWGTETDLFKPKSFDCVESNIVTFFHSCGPTPERKGTDLLIKSYAKVKGPSKLIIHTQTNLKKKFPSLSTDLTALESAEKLEVIQESVGAPGLYHLGDVYVYPSRLEGIGLTMAEALSCGLPLITSDNGPMNEFVNGENGHLVKIERYFPRKDNYYWPLCEVNLDCLTRVMQDYVDQIESLVEKKKCARKYAERNLNWYNQASRVNEIFLQTHQRDSVEKQNALQQISRLKNNSSDIRVRLYEKMPLLYGVLHRCWKKLKNQKIAKNIDRKR